MTWTQQMDALGRANVIRSARAELKRQIREAPNDESRRRAREVIRETPPWAESMEVIDLLRPVYYWGPAKAHKALEEAAVSANRQLGTLTDRERRVLMGALT